MPLSNNIAEQSNKETPKTVAIFIGKLTDQYDALVHSGYQNALRASELNSITYVNISPSKKWSYGQAEHLIDHLMDPDRIDFGAVHVGVMLARFGRKAAEDFAYRMRKLGPMICLHVEINGLPYLKIDNYSAMRELVEHLIQVHDYKKIGFVSGSQEHDEAKTRKEAYIDTLNAHNISVDHRFIYDGTFLVDSGREAAAVFDDQLLKEMDAVVMSNDTMAKAFINEIKRRGFRVPQDIAVTGYDNLADTKYFSPPLSTVAQPIQEQSAKVIDIAVDVLINQKEICVENDLISRFLPRRSCGCVYDRGKEEDEPSDENWIFEMLQSAETIHENGRRFLGAYGWEGLIDAVVETSQEIGLKFCYIFSNQESADKNSTILIGGYDQDGKLSKPDSARPFDSKNILTDFLWQKHPRYHLLVETLLFEEELLGHIVFDAGLKESWIYESMRAQISKAIKTIQLIEREKLFVDNLATEVKLRTQDLEQLVNERAELMRIAAHDLRNPLSVILLTAGKLERGWDKVSAENSKASIKRIEGSALKMNSIINRLVTVGKIEQESLSVNNQLVNINLLMANIINDQRTVADQKDILIVFEPPTECMLTTDPDLLDQILTNLLSNAIKYSPPQTEVAVFVEMLANKTTISIRDCGPGFTADDKEKLFGKYARLSAKPTGGEESIGLGLFIVKRLVSALNGHIQMRNNQPQIGSTFTVSLPNSS